jgi:hypothetical protein
VHFFKKGCGTSRLCGDSLIIVHVHGLPTRTNGTTLETSRHSH